VRLTIAPPSQRRLTRQYGIVNIPQPYRPLRPVRSRALLFYITFILLHFIVTVWSKANTSAVVIRVTHI
jgi:hypothetical protein